MTAGGDVDFATLLRRHRTAAGLSQEQLAESSDVAIRTVRNLELGHVKVPRAGTALDLAEGLALEPADRERFLRSAHDARRLPTDRQYRPAPWACAMPDHPTDFVGREAEHQVVSELADRLLTAGRAPVTALLTGQGGVGKTTAAARSAQSLAPRFADGARYLDLAGMTATPLTVAAGLHRLLRSLGVPEQHVPAAPDDRLALYRTLAAEHSGVLVLDNAFDEAQVRPLVPRAGRWLVLVTSRRSLANLPVDQRLVLDLLTAQEARRLVHLLVGEQRLGAADEQQAEYYVGDLVELCGRLPLALRIAGQRLASRPNWSVRSLTDRLRDAQRRLTSLSAGDLQVRSSFAVSYDQLTLTERTIFRRLPTIPITGYSPEVAAALVDGDEAAAERALVELFETGLVVRSAAPGRYELHDLVRLFAHERAVAEDEDREVAREHARRRLMATAISAGLLFDPDLPPNPGSDRWTSADEAMAWLEDEQDAWLWAVRRTAEAGEHEEFIAVADALHWYSDRRRFRVPWLEFFTLAVEAAVAMGDPRQEVIRRNQLGWTLSDVEDRPQDALVEHVRSLAIAETLKDSEQLAWSHYYRGALLRALGNPADGEPHLRRSMLLFRERGYQLGFILACGQAAMTSFDQDDPDSAAETLSEGLTALRAEHTDTVSTGNFEGYLLIFAGRIANARGRHAEALTMFTDGIAAYAKALDHHGQIVCTRELGNTHRIAGDARTAVAVLDHALNLALRESSVEEQVKIMHLLGQAYVADGSPEDAKAVWTRGLDIATALDLPANRSTATKITELLHHLDAT